MIEIEEIQAEVNVADGAGGNDATKIHLKIFLGSSSQLKLESTAGAVEKNVRVNVVEIVFRDKSEVPFFYLAVVKGFRVLFTVSEDTPDVSPLVRIESFEKKFVEDHRRAPVIERVSPFGDRLAAPARRDLAFDAVDLPQRLHVPAVNHTFSFSKIERCIALEIGLNVYAVLGDGGRIGFVQQQE